jgi:virginiamycin B lyase
MTDSGDGLILKMTTNGSFTPYTLNSAAPEGIVSGPERALWFVENYFRGAAVGRITTSGQITLFTKGISSGAALQDITVGSDGNLWFTEPFGDRIGRITKHGKITEYSAGVTPGSKPYSIASGPDGALWFTEIAGGRIGRITTAGAVTEYSHGITPTEGPLDLAAGSDGAMWFTEYESVGSYQISASKIGRVTMSGKITEYSKIDPTSAPTTIVQGPDRNMWFVEMRANRAGRVTL